MQIVNDDNTINVEFQCRIKTKSFNQIWIIDLKAHEVSSKEALEEDENIQI